MDIVTYALLKKRIDNCTPGYTYEGSADSVSDLPGDAEKGDLYTVDGVQYVWDGENWVEVNLGTPITTAQIDALF